MTTSTHPDDEPVDGKREANRMDVTHANDSGIDAADAQSDDDDDEQSDDGSGGNGAGDDERPPRIDRPGNQQTHATRAVVEWVVLVGGALLVALIVKAFLFTPFYIPSESMEPTLHGCGTCNNDKILVNQLSYKFGNGVPERGDIVVFDRPNGWPAELKDLVKRVVALPGETVSARDGFVYIDGKRLSEPYVNIASNPHHTPTGAGCPTAVSNEALKTQKIPKGYVFVMGDNRCNSQDSRVNGPIPIDKIVGRAFVRFWPLSHLGFL